MSKSKTNASHKERVNNFKIKQKRKSMSTQATLPESPIEQQYPVWNSKDNIEMNGLEFEAIYGFLSQFRNAVIAGENILQRNLASGVIKYVYKDKDGKDVPIEEVTKYQQAVEKFFASQASKNGQEGIPSIDAIVGPDGEPIKS